MNKPFFSVVIPLYNKENYIEATLKSVLNQTFKNFEIIVINDGSTDNSQQVVKTFSDDRIQVIQQNNQGLSASRNTGISYSKGNIIALLDADDIWNSEFLNTIYKLYKTFPEAFLFGTNYLEKRSSRNIIEPVKNIDLKLKGKEFIIEDFFLANMFQSIVCPSSLAFKKEVTNSFLFNNKINYAEDVDFYLKCFVKYKLAYSYNTLVTHLINVPNQITSLGIKNKTLPDLNYYETKHPNNQSLKKYLDFKRYMYAIQFKIYNDKKKFNFYISGINFKNLTLKQQVMLKSPLFITKILIWFKKLFLKFKIRLTTFKK